MNAELGQMDGRFVVRWIIATTVTAAVGVGLGFVVFWSLVEALEGPVGPALAGAIGGGALGALVGLGVGSGQAFALSGRGVNPGRWLLYGILGGALITAVLGLLGEALSSVAQNYGELLIGLVLGLGIGGGQWAALRGRFANSGAWVAISAAALAVGLAVAGAVADRLGEGNIVPVVLVMGLLIAGLTGLGAAWLFGRARPALAAPLGLLLALALLLAGCGGAAEPAVRFAQPRDGATVAAPVRVLMSAENFTVEPAGDGSIHDGAGHLHVMVDTPCLAAGQSIPKDDTHLHFGDGRTEAELDLPPGEHTLCLQAADGAHTALPGEGMTHTINVTVE